MAATALILDVDTGVDDAALGAGHPLHRFLGRLGDLVSARAETSR